jgi:HAD superfamily phosphatase (TIGR01668 family)
MLNLLTIAFKRLQIFIPQYILRQRPDKRIKRIKTISFPVKADTLASIDISCLVSFGIIGVILDLDNTIVSEDDRYLSPYAEAWIEQARELGFRFFFLSNGRRRYRVEYWSDYLGIPAIHPAKKPFPAAFYKAIKYLQLSPKRVVVIGDSRHTDILGAWLAGCRSIQVASLPHPPRWWEKLLGKYVQTPYPKGFDLWNFQPLNHKKN